MHSVRQSRFPRLLTSWPIPMGSSPRGDHLAERADARSARLCRQTPSSARERAVFSPGKDGEAGDVGFIVDTAGCSQAEKEPLEARPSFPTESRPYLRES